MEEGARRDRTRALFKKGQKCIVPILEADKETGKESLVYYEALIMRGEKRPRPDGNEAVYMYLIHYKGFGKQHDSWLEEKDLVKYDSDLVTGATSAAADEARRKAEETAEASRREAALQEIPVQLRLRVPPLLKKVILDDHAQVTQQGRALPLPRNKHARPCVADVLREWREARLSGAEVEDEVKQQVEEVEAGLRSYFDHALRHFLLYAPEVPVSDEATAGGAAPCDVYGAEHLARLLVKLPELVPVVMMAGQGDARNVVAVENHLHDLMTFMRDRQAKLFSCTDEYKPNPHWVPPPLAQVLPALQTAPAAAPTSAPATTEAIAAQ